MKIENYGQWVSAATNDSYYSHELHSIKNYEYAPFFEEFVSINSSGFFGKLGFGLNRINEFTIRSIAKAYMDNYSKNKEDEIIIVAHDGSFNADYLSKVFASVIRTTKTKVHLFNNNEKISLPMLSFITKRLKAKGGIYFSKSEDNKNEMTIKLIGDNGFLLDFSEYVKIHNNAQILDPFAIECSAKEIGFVSGQILDKYYDNLLIPQLRKEDSKLLNIHISAMHSSASSFITPILSKMNMNHKVSNHKIEKKDDLFDIRDKKNLSLGIKNARKHDADVIFTLTNDGTGLSIMAKQKRKFRLLNNGDISALVSNYLITEKRKNGETFENKYIHYEQYASNVTNKIAETNQIAISDSIENPKGKLLFSINRKNGISANESIITIQDAMQTIVIFTELANYYKSQRINIFDKLKQIYKQYGMYRYIVKTINLNNDYQTELINKIKDTKQLGDLEYEIDQKINSYEEKGFASIRATFKDGSWFVVKTRNNKVDVIMEAVNEKSVELVDVITFELEVMNFIEDNKKVDSAITIQRKDLIKFSFFGIFLGVVIWVLFDFIYKSTSSASVIKISETIFNETNRYLWLSVVFWWFMTFVIKAFARQRMLTRLGEKIPFYRQLLALLMSPIIDMITPFTFGGDLAGYWFLRKYGVKRDSLIATYFSNTIWFQLRLIIQLIILIPFSYKIYSQLLNPINTFNVLSLSMMIIGYLWCFITSSFIFSMMISKKFQETVLNIIIFLVELVPFINVIILEPKIAKIQYEFQKIRKSASKIWYNPISVLETFIYTIAPLFIVPQFFILSSNGLIGSSLSANEYLSQLVVEHIGKSANSLSITPGGLGSAEYLQMNVARFLYSDSKFINSHPPLFVSDVDHGFSVASGVDLLNKILLTLPFAVGSIFLIAGAWLIWDKRIKFQIKIENNILDKSIVSKKMKNTYIGIACFWTMYISVLLILFIVL